MHLSGCLGLVLCLVDWRSAASALANVRSWIGTELALAMTSWWLSVVAPWFEAQPHLGLVICGPAADGLVSGFLHVPIGWRERRVALP